MPDQAQFISAATLSLAALADIFMRSFEGYFYPANVTASVLATRTRVEQLDLVHSVVMVVDDEPAGVALLGLRGTRAWCGGFGITMPFRGRGLARPLGKAMLEQAQLAGATQLGLEVLTRNTPAIRTYQGLGLTIVRDLHIFEWAAGTDAEAQALTPPPEDALATFQPHELLPHFGSLHRVGAAWQRDLPALLVRSPMQGLGLEPDGIGGYVLFSVREETARIEDFGAKGFSEASRLLAELQARYTKLVSVNEPSDSPLSQAFPMCNFREVDRQHEMMVQWH